MDISRTITPADIANSSKKNNNNTDQRVTTAHIDETSEHEKKETHIDILSSETKKSRQQNAINL